MLGVVWHGCCVGIYVWGDLGVALSGLRIGGYILLVNVVCWEMGVFLCRHSMAGGCWGLYDVSGF